MGSVARKPNQKPAAKVPEFQWSLGLPARASLEMSPERWQPGFLLGLDITVVDY